MTASDSLTAVLDHIDRNRAGFLDRLIDYVRHPSISAQDIGIAEVGQLLLALVGRVLLRKSQDHECRSVPIGSAPSIGQGASGAGHRRRARSTLQT